MIGQNSLRILHWIAVKCFRNGQTRKMEKVVHFQRWFQYAITFIWFFFRIGLITRFTSVVYFQPKECKRCKFESDIKNQTRESYIHETGPVRSVVVVISWNTCLTCYICHLLGQLILINCSITWNKYEYLIKKKHVDSWETIPL